MVYGQATPETDRHPDLATRYDYDGVFGTVLNRFVVQAVVGHPLTVYGKGGQTRGMLDIRDTLQCVGLALDNPAAEGQYRVFNQFTETIAVEEVARRVSALSPKPVEIQYLTDPRVEQEDHYYKASHTTLMELGLVPHLLSDKLILSLMELVERYKDRVDLSTIWPTVEWRQTRNSVGKTTGW